MVMENANTVGEPAQAGAGAEAAESTAVDTTVLSDPIAQLAAVSQERDQLAAEKASLYDRLLRRQAEFENFRRRAERERAELLEFAGMETVRQILPVLDDFERGLKAAAPDSEFVRGFELIYQRLYETLRKLGLEPLTALGQPFDPNLHHAVERVATEESEENTVLEELQRGYIFRGKLLRPALVKVAVKS